MLADGTLESWDMLFTLPFQEASKEGETPDPQSVTWRPVPPQKRQGAVDVMGAMDYIAESLLDNQGYYIQYENNPNRLWFPYAVADLINVGDEYVNIDNEETYKVAEVFKTTDPKTQQEVKTGEVLITDLNGAAAAPAQWHRLRPKNHLRFMHAYPKTLASPYVFDPPTGTEVPSLKVPAPDNQGERAPWVDTITWGTIRREPGGLQRPFEDPRETKPRHREAMQSSKLDNCDYVHFIEGQLFDNIIQFDIWSQENEQAERLAIWFQDFFERYRWVWKYNGVKEILYWQQNADALVTRWRNDIVSRSIQLYFQTERLRNYPVRRIVDIEIALDTLVAGETLQPKPTVVDPTACVDPTGVLSDIQLLDGPGISLTQ